MVKLSSRFIEMMGRPLLEGEERREAPRSMNLFFIDLLIYY